MTIINQLTDEFVALGYSRAAVLEDYTFADVLSNSGDTRTVALAAFTQTPPSYRTAAFGVLISNAEDTQWRLQHCKALGAPALFVVSQTDVEVWQIKADGPPRRISTAPIGEMKGLFARHQEYWNPLAVHRAKVMDIPTRARQLDFVDIGLMIAIEGEVHAKLDTLLQETLAPTSDARGRPGMDARILFQATFRFLAAKILADRRHSASAQWNDGSIDSVLSGIEEYYRLPPVQIKTTKDRRLLEGVWDRLRSGINFRNISSDDLAFVYENTFVTGEVRAKLGTHSTPRQMAELVVRSLELWRDPNNSRIYEPFTGAGVFLVAALRQLRGALPLDWTDEQRHAFLTQRLSGDELDAFAVEVAKLSLILADYPNHNGWDIQQADLFRNDRITQRIHSNTFVLCNPPFEDFAESGRISNSDLRSLSKPITVLDAALRAEPAGLGFVLPASFPIEKRYKPIRERLEQDFTSIEIVEIPDDVFQASRTAASLLVARDRRVSSYRQLHLVSREVSLRDRLPFLKAGVLTRTRELTRWIDDPPIGNLWVPALHELWQQLEANPRLGSLVTIHRGIEWSIDQSEAASARPQRGFKRGLHSSRDRVQYAQQPTQWLDCRPEHSRGGALSLPWHKDKIILNAARLSRYQWRLAATVDTEGLICSQQFIGMWPRESMQRASMLELCAALNGPVANAFSAVFTSPGARFRLATLARIPLPEAFRPTVAPLVEAYLVSLRDGGDDKKLQELLIAIDAEVLQSYDLSTRVERELLEYFEGARRPVAHVWTGWTDLAAAPGLRLSEIRAGVAARLKNNWIGDVFAALPEDEARDLREYID